MLSYVMRNVFMSRNISFPLRKVAQLQKKIVVPLPTFTNIDRTYKTQMQTWRDGLCEKYSKEMDFSNYFNETMKGVVDSEKSQVLFPLVLHSPFVSREGLFQLFTLYNDDPSLFLYDLFENKLVFKTLKNKLQSSLNNMVMDDILYLAHLINTLKCHDKQVSYLNSLLIQIVSNIEEKFKFAGNLGEFLDSIAIAYNICGNYFFECFNIEVMSEYFEEHLEEASTNDFVQMLIYLSLFRQKRIGVTELELATNIMVKVNENVQQLSFDQTTDVNTALYILQIKRHVDNTNFYNNMLNITKEKLKSMESVSQIDRTSFIGIIKEIRYNKIADYEFLNLLKNFILDDKSNSLLFSESIADVMALFSHKKFYNEKLYTKIEDMINQHLDQNLLKVKDVTRILWASSFVQHHLQDSTTNKIVTLLQISDPFQMNPSLDPQNLRVSNSPEYNRIVFAKEEQKFFQYLWCICDCCLSLAQFEHFPESLIKKLMMNNAKNIKSDHKQANYYKKLVNLNEILKDKCPALWQPEIEKLEISSNK